MLRLLLPRSGGVRSEENSTDHGRKPPEVMAAPTAGRQQSYTFARDDGEENRQTTGRSWPLVSARVRSRAICGL